jgi:hypothetical protein
MLREEEEGRRGSEEQKKNLHRHVVTKCWSRRRLRQSGELDFTFLQI